MALRSKPIHLGYGLTVVALAIALIPQAISQQSQQSGPLRDVCREGWLRYECGSTRVCVSPELPRQYDLAASTAWSVYCGLRGSPTTQNILPDSWAHATGEEIGYLSQSYRWRGYDFHDRVLNFDSAMVKNGDLNGAIKALFSRNGDSYPYFIDRFNEGRAKQGNTNSIEDSLERYGIHLPATNAPVTDVCPAAWSRYSCRFVRLCVSPSVAAKYDLASSKEFGYADCKADNRSVPEKDTHLSPQDVGFAAGALLTGPRYSRAVKLDSLNIFDGNIDEAIQRLVLVPIPTSGLMDYDRGYDKGRALFEEYLAKNRQKESKGPS